MASKSPASIQDYIDRLPPERQEVMTSMRAFLRKHVPRGFEETLNWGMICYEVPLSRYPDTYNGQPLSYVALAAQKDYCALYLNCFAPDSSQQEQLQAAFREAGKKLDMGKSCIRFHTTDDLPIDALARIIAATPVEMFLAQYEQSRKKAGSALARPRSAGTKTRRAGATASSGATSRAAARTKPRKKAPRKTSSKKTRVATRGRRRTASARRKK